MKRFPHTNAQFIAVLVFAVSALGALVVLQTSSIGNWLKAVPIPPEGACYIRQREGETWRTSCTQTATLADCKKSAGENPYYFFVPGGVCPKPGSADACEKAGTDLIIGSQGSGSGKTEEESRKRATANCKRDLLTSNNRTLVCPVGCDPFLKYYTEKCTTRKEGESDFSTTCDCEGILACSSSQNGAPPEPTVVPFAQAVGSPRPSVPRVGEEEPIPSGAPIK